MAILLTIAARGGSKGIKNKNIQRIAGIPLIGITIKQALHSGIADNIIVTTDSEEIAKVAKEYGADVPFLRPHELATDMAGKIPALRHALTEAERHYSKQFDEIIDLDPTAPLRKNQDILNAHALFQEKKPQTLFSVTKAHKSPYFNMVELNKDGYAELSKTGKTLIRRQDSPIVYSMNASIYVYQREYLMDSNNMSAISSKSIIYEMEDLSGTDIDREIDLKFIEFLIKEGLWSFEF